MAHTRGGTNRALAAERRHLLAQRVSTGKPEGEQTESALADGTRPVTDSERGWAN